MNNSSSYALLTVGGILMAIGLGVVLVGCDSDNSAESIQGQRVSNLSKKQGQSIIINIGLVITVIGIGLVVTGVVNKPSSEMPSLWERREASLFQVFKLPFGNCMDRGISDKSAG